MSNPALEVQLRADIAAFQQGMNSAVASLTKLTATAKSTDGNVKSMASSIRGIGALIAVEFGAKALSALRQLQSEFIEMVEAPQNLAASFKALTGDATRAADILTRTFSVAREVGAGFNDVADVTKRITIGMRELGATNADISQMTENLFKLGRIGGSSIADTTAAALQLSQGLASGRLQGDELRSIMERMPLLAQAIAKEMGVSIGAIKELGSEGKITSDIIANALLKQTQDINKQFKEMPVTMEQAMNNVKTSIAQALNNPVVIGAVQGLAQAINSIATYVDDAVRNIRNFSTAFSSAIPGMQQMISNSTTLKLALAGIVTVLGVQLAPALAAAGAAVVAFGRSLAVAALSNPFTALIAAATLAAGAIILNWDRVVNFFTNYFPSALEGLRGAFESVMGNIIQIVAAAWQKILDIFQSGVNAAIGLINNMINGLNSAAGYFTDGRIVEPLKEINLQQTKLADSAKAWGEAASQSYQRASQHYENYLEGVRKLDEAENKLSSETQQANEQLTEFKQNAEQAGAAAQNMGNKAGGAGGGLKKLATEAKDAAAQMNSAAQEFQSAFMSFAEQAGSALGQAIANGEKLSDVFKKLLGDLAQMLIKLILMQAFSGIFGGGGIGGIGGGGGIGGFRSIYGTSSRTAGDYSGFVSRSSAHSLSSSMNALSPKSQEQVVNIQVNNTASNDVDARISKDENNRIMVEIVKKQIISEVMRGGSDFSTALEKKYRLNRV